MQCDYLIVGAGLFGSVFARKAAEEDKKIIIVDQRNHIGGNCYTERIEDINVHMYGPHNFHTNNEEVWKFVNRFAKFNNFQCHTKVNYKNNVYSFPINMMTLHQIWGVKTPSEAVAKLEKVRISCEKPNNCRDWCLSQIGEELYETFVKGYTTKQWGKDPSELPSYIIKRIPIRLTWDDRYFDDLYQGIPIGGYTQMFENILDHPNISVQLNLDFFEQKKFCETIANKIVYTGKIDQFFDYKHGFLDYRSLKFERRTLEGDFQGNAVMNYTEQTIPYTRIVEAKHFEFKKCEKTVVTWEYPDKYEQGKIPYYPIRDQRNTEIYKKYKEEADLLENYVFGGRLGGYVYLDMAPTILQAINMFRENK